MASLRPLAASQALFLCAMGINLSITALAGARLSSHPTPATVPMAVIPISNVIFAPSVNRILHRRGPRTVGVGGAAPGALGGLLATFAVVVDSLPALIIAMIPAGAFQAVANHYRYLAADLRPGDEDAAVSPMHVPEEPRCPQTTLADLQAVRPRNAGAGSSPTATMSFSASRFDDFAVMGWTDSR